MQREIKFRAWDKHHRAWITEPVGFTMSVVDGKFHIFGFDDAFADMYQVKIELQQYTGLQDKNGVEIYEGDLIKREGRFTERIVWDRGAFVAEMVAPEYLANHGHRGLIYDNIKEWKKQGVEVIGNIYEDDPELMNGGGSA